MFSDNDLDKLKKKMVIEYYTDRVLESDSKKIDAGRMSIRQVVKEKDVVDRNISFSSSLKNWPSLTQAKLGAIWSALLTAPCKIETHIFTDSKAAIEALEKDNANNKTCSQFKMKNRSIISQIKAVARRKI